MKKTISNILTVLLLAVLLAGCRDIVDEPVAPQLDDPIATLPAAPSPVSITPEESADPIEALIGAMSIEEKCAQLLVAGIEGTTAGSDARYAVEQLGVGGVILFRRNVSTTAQVTALNQSLAEMATIPLFLGVDEEGGRVSRLPEGVDKLPAMGKADGDFYTMGLELGETLAALGYNINFAPVLDVHSNPANTVIGDRAFGTQAQAVVDRAIPFAQGLLEAQLVPVGKHFPGHGDTAVDSHTALPILTKTLEELEAVELVPFRAAIEADLPAIMIGHLVVDTVDPQNPATFSYPVVTQWLREDLGFEGLVMTDDLTMGALEGYTMDQRAVRAVEAGCDLLLICHKRENLELAHRGLVAAVEEGRLTQARLDESVRRILIAKNLFT